MTTNDPLREADPADQFGRAVAARLGAGTEDISYEAGERLRAARVRALQARKKPEAAPVLAGQHGGAGTLALGEGRPGPWRRFAAVLPLLLLAGGLVLLHSVQSEQRASELAEVDAALLTDDLPPAAYADPGFVHFLKQSARAE